MENDHPQATLFFWCACDGTWDALAEQPGLSPMDLALLMRVPLQVRRSSGASRAGGSLQWTAHD